MLVVEKATFLFGQPCSILWTGVDRFGAVWRHAQTVTHIPGADIRVSVRAFTLFDCDNDKLRDQFRLLHAV